MHRHDEWMTPSPAPTAGPLTDGPVCDVPCWDDATGPLLVSEAVEQAARLCGDEVAVYRLSTVSPGTGPAVVAVGRILSALTPDALSSCDAFSPLMCLVAGRSPSLTWRERTPVVTGSLLCRVQTLEALLGLHERDRPYGQAVLGYLDCLQQQLAF